MSRPFVCLLLAVACLGVGAASADEATAVAGPTLRVNGSWRGEVRPDPRLPLLPWRLRLDARMGGTTALDIVAETPAGELHATVRQPPDDAPATWQVPAQVLDVAALRTWLAPLLALPAGLAPDGEVTVSGQGAWQEADGVAGELALTWPAAALAWPEHDLTIEAPRVEARVILTASAIAQLDLMARWERARIASVQLGAGRLRARRAGEGPWQFEDVVVEAWRGQVSLAPFALDPAKPAFDTTVTVDAVALGELAAFFPQAVRAADGRLSGEFALKWDAPNGVRPGRGTLRVLGAELARVQLAASPGLLSGRVPARIGVLPDWLGPLAKWTAVENPARGELQRIELGERFIRVDSLEVALHPEGLDGPVSARVRLVGRPEVSDLVEKVDFTVNVSGPLQELIELGLDKRSRVTTGAR